MRLTDGVYLAAGGAHAHSNHAGATAEWRERFGVTFAASREAAQHVRGGDEEKIRLAVAKRGRFYPQDYVFRACPVERELQEGGAFEVGDLSLRWIETPGHCLGLISLVNSIEKLPLLKVDALMPSRLTTALENGDIHIRKAWDTLQRLAPPPNII